MTGAFVTRFAPSPTGRLHLGHAFSALTAYRAAQAAGGRCLLRIEDIDQIRARPAFEAGIYEDLAWLGLAWENPVRRQSEHMADYAAILQILINSGLVYRCFRTRRELLADSANAPHGPGERLRPGPHPPKDEAQRLAAGEPFAWRLWLDRCREILGERFETLAFEADGVRVAAQPWLAGDAILARKDFPASYHLASVWDDALQGVTHVIRGEDLREAAHLHALLQELLGLPRPLYRHHALILGPDGKRLSKRDKARTLQSLREDGATCEDILALLRLS